MIIPPYHQNQVIDLLKCNEIGSAYKNATEQYVNEQVTFSHENMSLFLFVSSFVYSTFNKLFAENVLVIKGFQKVKSKTGLSCFATWLTGFFFHLALFLLIGFP